MYLRVLGSLMLLPALQCVPLAVVRARVRSSMLGGDAWLSSGSVGQIGCCFGQFLRITKRQRIERISRRRPRSAAVSWRQVALVLCGSPRSSPTCAQTSRRSRLRWQQ